MLAPEECPGDQPLPAARSFKSLSILREGNSFGETWNLELGAGEWLLAMLAATWKTQEDGGGRSCGVHPWAQSPWVHGCHLVVRQVRNLELVVCHGQHSTLAIHLEAGP